MHRVIEQPGAHFRFDTLLARQENDVESMLQDGVARVGRYVVNGDKVFQGIGTALAAMYKCEPRPQADHPLVDGFSALRWSAVRGLFSFTAGLVRRTWNPLALDLETACGGLNMLIEHSDSFAISWLTGRVFKLRRSARR